MIFNLMRRKKPEPDSTEALYEQYAPLVYRLLLKVHHIQEEDVKDVLFVVLDKFEKALHGKKPIRNREGLLWLIARQAAASYRAKHDKFLTGYESHEFDMQEEDWLTTLCLERALLAFKQDFPASLCPLLITLSDHKHAIEEIAAISYQSVSDARKQLRKCRKTVKRYRDYNEYQEEHGLESLCWLVSYMSSMGWTAGEMAEILGKSEDAVRQTASRCRKKFREYRQKYCKEGGGHGEG